MHAVSPLTGLYTSCSISNVSKPTGTHVAYFQVSADGIHITVVRCLAFIEFICIYINMNKHIPSPIDNILIPSWQLTVSMQFTHLQRV